MLKNTPQMSTEEFNEANKYLLKSGRLLRKYSLDELPQLINIIEGKMKFIGPRPCMVDSERELKILREKYKVDQLTPGITGWAQVNGRDLNTIRKKAELDYYYKLNESFLLDTKIILITLFVVLFSRGIKH